MKKLQLALGLSKPLNIFENAIDLLKVAIESNFYLHVSITYPVNAFILKYLLPSKFKYKKKLITKILGEDKIVFDKSLDLSLKRFGGKYIDIVQIVNLPLKKNSIRNLKNLDITKYNDLKNQFISQKIKGKFKKIFLEIFESDDIDLIKNISQDFDGFIFRGNQREFYINEKIYDFLIKKEFDFIVYSIFDGGKFVDKNAYLNTFNFFSRNFKNNIILINRTNKLLRLKEAIKNLDQIKKNSQSLSTKRKSLQSENDQVLEMFSICQEAENNQSTTNSKRNKPIFLKDNESQVKSSIFFRESNCSNIYFSLRSILKDLILIIRKLFK